MADGQVVFEIKGDASNVNQTVKQVTGNIQQESKKWDQAVSDSTEKSGKSFLNWKTVATGAVTAVSAALIKFGKEAIDAASDLQEVQNVVDTVFGDGSRQIDDWARKAGEKFGLTETMAKRFTSTLGAMMKSSGLAGKEIVGMSTDLAGLAADMASFYNLDFETAFEKIRSGISGETMPLKQLGINMSVANLEAFALAQGLEKTFSEMSQGEQTMLRYQYLMQATADAQGDFEKTSDGFANAQRRIQSSLASIETSIGKMIIEPFANATAGVADFLAKIASDMMPEKTILDEFNEIEVDTGTKLAEIQSTYDSASDLIKILKEIESETATLQDGTTISLTSLFGDIAEIEKSGGDVGAYIASLGLDVDEITLKYNKWKEATKQLTSLVPSLTNVIDSETGAIDGGTDALQRNLDEWKRVEENKVYWAEYYAMEQEVARAKGEQAGLQITARARQLAADRARAEMEKQAAGLGIDLDWYEGNYDWTKFGGQTNTRTAEQNAYNDAVDNYIRLQGEADGAQKKAEQSANDLADAEGLLADKRSAVEEITGETLAQHEKANKQTVELTENMTLLEKAMAGDADAAKELSGAWEQAGAALKAVSDYYKSVEDATRQAVNSTLKGFEQVSKAGDDLRKQKEQIDSDLAKAEAENAKLLAKYGGVEGIAKMDDAAWKKLPPEVQDAYNEIANLIKKQDELNESVNQYSPESMISGLQSQINYIDEYLENLQWAQDNGLSAGLLAQLADGSKASAEYLAQLKGADSETIDTLNSKYATLEEKQAGFTKTLTDTKLAADDAYQALIDAATKSLQDLNLHDSTKKSLEETVQGIADGINDKLPDVRNAVNAVLEELNRLNGLGITVNIGGSDSSAGRRMTGNVEGVFASGTDYIPHDNFLAMLHEGEAVLTAEENKIWQMFRNQQPGMDYDTLGGVMSESIKPGGDVYLEGRVVGRVISDIQGNQYRTLQRSGWQQ